MGPDLSRSGDLTPGQKRSHVQARPAQAPVRDQPPRSLHGDLARPGWLAPSPRLLHPRRAPGELTPSPARTRRTGRGPALYEPLHAEHVDRLELLSARLVHDEVQ